MSPIPRPLGPRHRAHSHSGRWAFRRHAQPYLPIVAATIQLITVVVRVVRDR
jgi:hypothetical protein